VQYPADDTCCVDIICSDTDSENLSLHSSLSPHLRYDLHCRASRHFT